MPVPRKGTRSARSELGPQRPAEANRPDLAQSCPPRHPAPASRKGPTGPTLRANPCPEVTDQNCRFPLPTFIYRLEAPNLGDLMRRWVQSVSKQGHHERAGKADHGGQPTAPAPDSDPCDFLTCIFHGLALVHGTTQELCRSTATVWFAIPSPPSRFIGFPGITGPKTEKKTLPRTRRQWTQARSRCQESSHT